MSRFFPLNTARRRRASAGLALGLLLLAGAACPRARAGGGPENVAVVVNERSWASLAVANEFVRLRQVPPGNVIYLADVPGFEETGVGQFRERILLPALRTLEERGLAAQIDYLVYSADFPYAINVNDDLTGVTLPRVITQPAAITGLTYLYAFTLSGKPGYLGLGTNAYMRNPVPPRPDTAWDEAETKRLTEALRALGEIKEARRKRADEVAKAAPDAPRPTLPADEPLRWATAVADLRALTGPHPHAPALRYNLACALALDGQPDAALAELRTALEAGWSDAEHIRADADLATLRGRPEFDAILAEMANVRITLQPTRGFRAQYAWGTNGELAPAGQGVRYLLSTLLAVTSGRGLSVSEALDHLRRAAAADGTRPAGTIYYLTNDDIRAKVRAPQFRPAVAMLAELGVKAEILEGVLPQGKADVAGAMVGVSDFQWPHSGSTILPGAICEHLTSTGGVLNWRGGQSPLTEFLRHGAAGAAGTVTEPYAITAKFPSPFLHVHYARGCSLAEAFYQSVAGPYQLLIVGDPLCRPWAIPPHVTLAGLRPNEPVRGTVTLSPQALPAAGTAVAAFELFLDGRRFAVLRPGQTATLNTVGLADGHHELRAVAVLADPVETRGNVVLPLLVRNHDVAFDRAATPTAPVGLHESVTVELAATGAEEIRLLHNGRELGRLAGDRGTLRVPAARLGLGQTRLQALAVFPGEPTLRHVHSAPLAVTVIPPPPLAAGLAPVAPAGVTLARGLLLRPAAGAPVSVKQLTGGWLAALKLPDDTVVTVEAWFEVSADGLAQLQVLPGTKRIELAVDDQVLALPETPGWSYLALNLAKGWHRFRLVGRSGGDAPDLRFGVAGTRPMDETHFRHIPPPAPPAP